MAPKRATRSTPVTTTPAPTATTTTTVTNAQLQAMIDQGVSAALAARDANRNGVDSHTSGMVEAEGVVELLTNGLKEMETVCSNMKKMTDKYCPRNEMKKLEAELREILKVIGTDVVKYNQRFQELALLCVRMFPEEADKIESTIAERQVCVEHKRKLANLPANETNNATQAHQNKRQSTGRDTTAGSGERKSLRMGDLDPYAQNAITTMTVRVLQSAINATSTVTSPVIVGGDTSKNVQDLKEQKGKPCKLMPVELVVLMLLIEVHGRAGFLSFWHMSHLQKRFSQDTKSDEVATEDFFSRTPLSSRSFAPEAAFTEDLARALGHVSHPDSDKVDAFKIALCVLVARAPR
ncbi:hypothetical protein Tco_0572862 [Tanacetum coccineum]